MATSAEFAGYIGDQLASLERITVKKMFGEYGVWLEEKYVGCICDDQLFVKDTPAGRAFAPALELAPPYEGAGNALLVADPEDADFVTELIRLTYAALPRPRKKKPKAPRF